MNYSIPPLVIGIIPAYKPEVALIRIIKELHEAKVCHKLVVIDDASGSNFTELFNEIEQIPEVVVLHLAVNSGMGGAIKYGLQYALYHYPQAVGFVMFDADGQHLSKDIERVVKEFCLTPHKTILGVRNFYDSEISIPLRSRFGNRFTEIIFTLATGIHLSDTQTGLRCYPANIAKEIVKLIHNRYEFQLEALLLSVTKGEITQIPIQTVYENQNRCSHFRPIVDSIKIYSVFLRFIASSLICCLIDYIIFILVYFLTGLLGTSLVTARIFSVAVNFFLNRSKVFENKQNRFIQAIKFTLLALFLLLGSYCGISLLQKYCAVPAPIAKIIAEVSLFIISFIVQRFWIFKK